MDVIPGKSITIPPLPDFYSRRETAHRLGVSMATLCDWLRHGTIPSSKVGKRRLIPRAWLDQLEREAMATLRK